jgi:hypothetical protein
VILILHGNFDRPEWECGWWHNIGVTRGWMLCPRGIPRTDVPRSYDRWTYAGSTPALRETHAGLDVLQKRYRGLISEERAILIGFSLGAILAPRVMLKSRLAFSHAVLVEGGAGVDGSQIRSLKARGLRRVAYLCGQYSGCRNRARKAERRWRRGGVPARTWIMPGVGHGYSDDFDKLGEIAVKWLLEDDPPRAPGPAPSSPMTK